MSTFDQAVEHLLSNEGSHVIAQDNGRGASRWGVTVATYRELHPGATDQDIRQLTKAQATEFYRSAFWARYHLEVIADQAVATKALDLAANIGGGAAVKLIQRALGVGADGVLGRRTAKAINERPASTVLTAIRRAGTQYYRELADRRPEYSRFLAGWLERLQG